MPGVPGLDQETQRREPGIPSALHRENWPGMTTRQREGPGVLPAGLCRQGGGGWSQMIGPIQQSPRGCFKMRAKGCSVHKGGCCVIHGPRMGCGMAPEETRKGLSTRQLESSHSGQRGNDKEPVTIGAIY